MRRSRLLGFAKTLGRRCVVRNGYMPADRQRPQVFRRFWSLSVQAACVDGVPEQDDLTAMFAMFVLPALLVQVAVGVADVFDVRRELT